MAHKDDLYSYAMTVQGSLQEQLRVYELLMKAGIIHQYLEPIGPDDAPYSQYFYPEAHGSGPAWNEEEMEILLHDIALKVPNIVMTLDGENTDDRSVGFRKRFHGDLYQEKRRITTMPPLEEGRDLPFSERNSLKQVEPDAPMKIHFLCEEFEGEEAIREFRILAVAQNKDDLRLLLQAKVDQDEHGFIALNGVSEDGPDSFSTKYEDGIIKYYIEEASVLNTEQIKELLQTKGYETVFSYPDGFKALLMEEIRLCAEERGFGSVDAEKTANYMMGDKVFQALLKEAFWFSSETLDEKALPIIKNNLSASLSYSIRQDEDFFERIGAMPAFNGPANLKEILHNSIYDVARDYHLPVTQPNTLAESIFRNADFRRVFNKLGPAPLQEGTDTYQDAVWSCYDFAQEKLLKHEGNLPRKNPSLNSMLKTAASRTDHRSITTSEKELEK